MKVLTIVNPFSRQKSEGDFSLFTSCEEKAPANSVPAAAVRQKVQVFSGIIGRKVEVGGKPHSCF